MKLKTGILAFSIFLFSWSNVLISQQSILFQVDMNGVEMDDNTVIGIRGSVHPLSWSESIQMSDIDGDGIFTVTIEFSDAKPGDRILYKYMKDDLWDLDDYQQYGNRLVTLASCPQVNNLDKWNQFGGYTLESLQEYKNYNLLNQWLYILVTGKKNGYDTESIITDYIDFEGDDFSWAATPLEYLNMEIFKQSSYPDSKLEIIEKSPEKVVYKCFGTLEDYFIRYFGPYEIQGVKPSDFNMIQKIFCKVVCETLNWKYEIEDGPDYILYTIEKQ